MMAHGFRFVAPRVVGRGSGRQCLRYSNFARSHSFGRRRAVSVAAIVAATSLTALAASHDNNNQQNVNHFEPPPSNTAINGKTACEGQPTCTTFPEVLLKFDHYNGVIVHLDWIFHPPQNHNKDEEEEGMSPELQEQLQQLYEEWSNNPELFAEVLQRSLQKWKEEGRKGIWIHLPRTMASMVPACVKLGFDFHSCQNHNRINSGTERGSTTLILSQWLPTDIVSRLPLGPYFQAGVGCVVLHPEDCTKMLVVQEITGPAAARKLWKMPTGLIDPGEDVAEAAQRELAEETGLFDTKCQGILSFRQAHGASAGRAASDLFFVCLLTLSPQQQLSSLDKLQPQEHEIADIQWMPVEEYANQEVWQKSPVYQQLNQVILDAVDNQRLGKASHMVVPHQLPVGFSAGTNTVYRSNL